MLDGAISYTCELSKGHPNNGPWSWLESAPPPSAPNVSGIATELRLDIELPAALNALGQGWFEYGSVERSYVLRRPADFELLVEKWGHTASAPAQYTASAYIARTLGNLARAGSVAYHPGRGTGRWKYNDPISWWSMKPDIPWAN